MRTVLSTPGRISLPGFRRISPSVRLGRKDLPDRRALPATASKVRKGLPDRKAPPAQPEHKGQRDHKDLPALRVILSRAPRVPPDRKVHKDLPDRKALRATVFKECKALRA
jgi:hypothetical protein